MATPPGGRVTTPDTREDTVSRAVVRAYLLAKWDVVAAGYEEEIAWQETVSLAKVTATGFMREAAWVVFASGMRESIVRSKFHDLGSAFEQWRPDAIQRNSDGCRRRALKVFNHAPKVDAVVEIASTVEASGVQEVIEELRLHGPTALRRLPFIGPITCFHLAKNLGCAVAKPDRHLERIAGALGYDGASHLCRMISDRLDEPIQVVDLVLWRYATLEPDYTSRLRATVAEDLAGVA